MLSDSAIRAAKPRIAQAVKLSDGGGLQLWVQPSGSKLWNLAYRFAGKQPQASHRFISAHWIHLARRVRSTIFVRPSRASSMEPQVLRSISRRLEKGQSMLLEVPDSGRYSHIVIANRLLIVATAAYAL
jgi:hypothetical protein